VALAALVILSLFFATAGNVFVSGKTPLWVYHTSGTINSISISENGSRIAVGVGFTLNTGAVLLFDGGGNLLWEHQTSRIIGSVSISGNGSRIEANGYQILPGPAGVYANAEVYAFDSNGNMLWNRTAGFPWSATMSADGSRIAVVGSDLLTLLTWEGQAVWTYTAGGYPTGNNSAQEGPPTFFVSQNGTRVPVGANGITRLGSGENSILVNDGLYPIPESSIAVTPNGTLIAAGSSTSGTNGTVLLLTGQGDLLWKHHVDSAVLSEALLPNGSSVAYVTNSNALFYNSAGPLLANNTYGESNLLRTTNGLFLVGGAGGSGLELFNSVGRLLWSDPLNSVLTEDVSSNEAFAAAASGLSGQGGYGHPSTLYFFSTTGEGSLLTGLEGQVLNYSQSPIFILFEIGTGITIAALIAVLAIMFLRGREVPKDNSG
jgi:hypothetical protein